MSCAGQREKEMAIPAEGQNVTYYHSTARVGKLGLGFFFFSLYLVIFQFCIEKTKGFGTNFSLCMSSFSFVQVPYFDILAK